MLGSLGGSMRSWSSLIFMISMNQLLGYVLHPAGVVMCREFCCHITGKPSCAYSPIKLSCDVTRRNRLQAGNQWILLEISTRGQAMYESETTTCTVHSRLHQSRTKGFKCVEEFSKKKCAHGSGCVESYPRGQLQEKNTERHPQVTGKSSGWTKDYTKGYRRVTVGSVTIYIKRMNDAVTWDSANRICERDRGQLVKVGDKETVVQVAKLFTYMEKLRGVEVWIGLRDVCDNNRFLWLDGQAPSYTKWSMEEKMGFRFGRQGKCVTMRSALIGADWLSASCNSKHGYICQLLLPEKRRTFLREEFCNGSLKQTLGNSTSDIKGIR